MADLYHDGSEHLSRRQLSRNLILMRNKIGKSAPSSYNLPHECHAYGLPLPHDTESARDVCQYWSEHVPSPRRSVNSQNFLRVNSIAAKNNISNAKDLAKWRHQRDFPVETPRPEVLRPLVYPSDVVKGFAYGQKCRPSTPIKMVIANTFGADCEDEIDDRYRRYAHEKAAHDRPLAVRMTRSMRAQVRLAKERRDAETESSKKVQLPGQHDMWTMSRFKNVPSHFDQDKKDLLPSLPNNKDAVLDLRKPQAGII